MSERRVTITDEDIEFLRVAREHYTMFAEASEKQGGPRVAGLLRKQEFYAERFLLRVTASEEPKE